MSICGFFGKLPSRGDFLSRQLPQRLVQRLDDWLQDSLQYCIDADPDWETAFRDSPCWHFALGLGSEPGGLAGVMLPSRDRVGRDFPLILATPLATAPGLAFPMDWAEGYRQLTLLAHEAVDTPLEPDPLAERLAMLPAPPAIRGGAIPAMQPGLRLNLQGNNLSRTLAAFPHSSNLTSGSLWWHHGSAAQPPCVLVSAGLPPAQAAHSLWSGDWRDAPWRPIGH